MLIRSVDVANVIQTNADVHNKAYGLFLQKVSPLEKRIQAAKDKMENFEKDFYSAV